MVFLAVTVGKQANHYLKFKQKRNTSTVTGNGIDPKVSTS